MISHRYLRFYIALSSIFILVVGLFIGNYLASNLTADAGIIHLESIKIALLFTIIILLLIIGGIILEIREIVQLKKRGK